MTRFRLTHSSALTKNKFFTIAAILTMSLLNPLACSHTEKVLVPPKIDLVAYRAVGIIDFATTPKDDLREYVTQNFIQTVQSAQPGVRFLPLGSTEDVLKSVGRTRLDLNTIKLIGKTHQIDALFCGQFAVSDPKPNVRISSTWQSLKAGAHVEASLITKLWETDSGVILWTNSTYGNQPVAHLSASAVGGIHVGARDPEEAYGRLVPEMIYENTWDFRAYTVNQKVK